VDCVLVRQQRHGEKVRGETSAVPHLLIKSYQEDVKNKAAIFDDTLIKGFIVRKMENAYWLVR